MIARIWNTFWSPNPRYSLGFIFIVGGIAGVVFWGGFNTYMEYTNTLEFCIGCHEMRDHIFEEYKTTVHYKNASGVRVICSDCHVPKAWAPKLLRKIRATNELFHHFRRTITTPESFADKHLELAQSVWTGMETSDSRECRNCHSFDAMDLEKQRRRPQQKHAAAMEQGKTCIDCHKGIAHPLPDEYEEEDD
jgi:nitrate/TMAO reductase-like tetraheme cytochrome c subunit